MATTLTSTGITFNDASVQTSAASLYSNYVVRTTTGSWTVPAGVTDVIAIGIAGGGGGGSGYTTRDYTYYKGGDGGRGGLGIIQLITSPGSSISYTIGAGGAGSNSTSGVTGGNTNIISNDALLCTGGNRGLSTNTDRNGADGADGTSTSDSAFFNGSTLLTGFNAKSIDFVLNSIPISLEIISDIYNIISQSYYRPQATSSTAALTYSAALAFRPGAGGIGELSASLSNATGGVGGAVIFIY